jgi:hypothetical protein
MQRQCKGIFFFAFVGILILCGVLKKRKEPVRELFAITSPYYSRPVFSATMSRDRFSQILRCLRFDEKNRRVQRRKDDKLAPIQ